MKQSFSFSGNDKDYYCENKNKINHISCQFNGVECKSVLSSVNNSYLEFNRNYRIQNYSQSINELKKAFNKTSEIQRTDCQKCVKYFRSVVSQSLEDVCDELEKMSTGFFKTKRFNLSLIEAENTLEEFKNEFHLQSTMMKEHDFKTNPVRLVV